MGPLPSPKMGRLRFPGWPGFCLGGSADVWVVLSDEGELLESFPAGHEGWRQAVQWATRNGGELDVVFMAHVQPGWRSVAG